MEEKLRAGSVSWIAKCKEVTTVSFHEPTQNSKFFTSWVQKSISQRTSFTLFFCLSVHISLLKSLTAFSILTFVSACGGCSSGPASLGSPPSALRSPRDRQSRGGVAVVLIGTDLLRQERVDWKLRCRLPVVEMTQHVACDQQREVGDSGCVTMTQHFLS